MKETCKRARMEADKKFVRREDAQMTDERKEQLKLRIRELMEWEVTPSEKALIICEKYNIVVEGFNDRPRVTDTPKENVVKEQQLFTDEQMVCKDETVVIDEKNEDVELEKE
jgi:hypothetical protein